MDKVFLLYNSERVLIGVFDDLNLAVKASNEYDGYNLTEKDLEELKTYYRTTGLDINYLIEERVINQIG